VCHRRGPDLGLERPPTVVPAAMPAAAARPGVQAATTDAPLCRHAAGRSVVQRRRGSDGEGGREGERERERE